MNLKNILQINKENVEMSKCKCWNWNTRILTICVQKSPHTLPFRVEVPITDHIRDFALDLVKCKAMLRFPIQEDK